MRARWARPRARTGREAPGRPGWARLAERVRCLDGTEGRGRGGHRNRTLPRLRAKNRHRWQVLTVRSRRFAFAALSAEGHFASYLVKSTWRILVENSRLAAGVKRPQTVRNYQRERFFVRKVPSRAALMGETRTWRQRADTMRAAAQRSSHRPHGSNPCRAVAARRGSPATRQQRDARIADHTRDNGRSSRQAPPAPTSGRPAARALRPGARCLPDPAR